MPRFKNLGGADGYGVCVYVRGMTDIISYEFVGAFDKRSCVLRRCTGFIIESIGNFSYGIVIIINYVIAFEIVFKVI